MSRLIDADKLSEHKFTRESAKGSDYMRGWNDAIDAIVDNESTVITNSVYEAYCALSDEEFEHSDSFWITTPKGKKINFVKERPQGEWIDTGYMEEYWAEEYQCSICGEKDHWHNFCPNCGADMRGKEDEADTM